MPNAERANWFMLKLFNVLYRRDIQSTDKYGMFLVPEYHLSLTPRYGYGKPANPYLLARLEAEKERLRELIADCLQLEPFRREAAERHRRRQRPSRNGEIASSVAWTR